MPDVHSHDTQDRARGDEARSLDLDTLDLIQLRRGCTYCSVRQLCLPGGIGSEELQRLDRIVQRRRDVKRGERLFRQGEPLGALYVAREGAFKSVGVTEDGEEQILGFHIAGELIGLDGLGGGAHRCEGIALTAASVCELPYEQLGEVAAELPGLQQQLLRIIGQSLGRDQDHLSMLVRRQANERIALFLHSLDERLQTIGQPAHRMTLPMSREDIAGYLGLALETVSRGFTRLQDDAVIAVTGRRVEILAPDVLRRIAHGQGPDGTAPRGG